MPKEKLTAFDGALVFAVQRFDERMFYDCKFSLPVPHGHFLSRFHVATDIEVTVASTQRVFIARVMSLAFVRTKSPSHFRGECVLLLRKQLQ